MAKNTLEIVEKIVDVYNDDKVVQGIISSIEKGYGFSSKVELVCQCLNKELGAYGFHSYPSADKTAVLVNDETMSKVIEFFNQTGAEPRITTHHVERVKSMSNAANKNNISIFLATSYFQAQVLLS
jgi:hypothetical protein